MKNNKKTISAPNVRSILGKLTFLAICSLFIYLLFPPIAQMQSQNREITPNINESLNTLLSPQTTRPDVQWMRGGHNFLQAIDHAWDGDTMATMGSSEVKLWRTSDNTLLRTIPKTSSAGLNRVSLNSNGQYLAFTDGDLTVRVYNVVSGGLVRSFVVTDQVSIYDIDLSPNGGDLAISFGPNNPTLRVYRIDTGGIVADKPPDETGGGDIEYSWDNFISDYYLAAVDGGNGLNVRLYTPDNGYLPVCSESNPPNPPICTITGLGHSSLTFSKDGKYLAADSGLGVKVIRTSNLTNPLTSLTPSDGEHKIAFSPNTQHLVITGAALSNPPSAPDGGNILTFAVPAVGFPWTTTPLAQWNAESLGTGSLRIAFSNTSKLAVWGRQHIRFWNTENGLQCGNPMAQCNEFQNPFTDNYRSITAVAYSSDGTIVAAGEGSVIYPSSESNKIYLWNATTGARIKTLAYGANSTQVKSLAFPDNQNIIAGGTDGIKLIRISDGMILNSATETGEFVISPNRQMIAIGFYTGGSSVVVLRNTANLAFIRTIFTGGSGSGSNAIPLAFTPDNLGIAAIEFPQFLRLFNVNTGIEVFTFGTTISGTKARGAFTPNGQNFIGGAQTNIVHVWNATNGTFVRSLTGYTGNITAVNITPDGQYLFTASKDAKIRIWSISAPNPADWTLVQTYDEETGAVGGFGAVTIDPATLSPDGSRYFYGRFDAAVVMTGNPYAETLIQFSSPTYTVNENGVTATITATRTGGSAEAVGVTYSTSDDTATAGQDYTSATGTLAWADGELGNKTFTIQISNDNIYEPDETVNLILSNPTGRATLGSQSTAVLTINDDDNAPAISINDVTVTEPLSGTVTADFIVSLSSPSSQTITVQYATANGTAAAPGDYVAIPTTTLTFNPLETNKTISVTINSDLVVEVLEAV